jgi:hypothetical protein
VYNPVSRILLFCFNGFLVSLSISWSRYFSFVRFCDILGTVDDRYLQDLIALLDPEEEGGMIFRIF